MPNFGWTVYISSCSCWRVSSFALIIWSWIGYPLCSCFDGLTKELSCLFFTDIMRAIQETLLYLLVRVRVSYWFSCFLMYLIGHFVRKFRSWITRSGIRLCLPSLDAFFRFIDRLSIGSRSCVLICKRSEPKISELNIWLKVVFCVMEFNWGFFQFSLKDTNGFRIPWNHAKHSFQFLTPPEGVHQNKVTSFPNTAVPFIMNWSTFR